MPLNRTYTRKKHGITSWKFLWHSSLLHFFSSTLIGHSTVHHEYEHALHNPVSVLVSVLSFSVLFQFCFSPVQSCFSPVSVLFSPVSTLFQSCFRPVQSCFAVLFQSCSSPVSALFSFEIHEPGIRIAPSSFG